MNIRSTAAVVPAMVMMVTVGLFGVGPAGAQTLDDVRSEDSYTNDSAAVLRLYRAFFDREPDVDGARYWTELSAAGTSLDDMAWAFAASEEFTSSYGTELTDDEFLEIVYGNVLGRTPDDEGLGYWLDQMADGLARPEVVRWVTANAEFIYRYPYEPLGPGYSGPADYALGRIVDADGSANLVRLNLDTGVGKMLLVEAADYGRPVLHPAGRVAFVSQAEASACDDDAGAQPMVWQIDIATGQLVAMGAGARPQVSPDGRHLAYLRGTDCAATAAGVLGVVVVRDLLTGVEQPLSPGPSAHLVAGGLAWAGDDALRFGPWHIELGAEPSIVATSWSLPAADTPLGFVEGQIMVESIGETSVDLVSIDPATGDRTIVGSDPVDENPAWSVDVDGRVLAVAGDLIRPNDSAPFLSRPDGLDWLDW